MQAATTARGALGGLLGKCHVWLADVESSTVGWLTPLAMSTCCLLGSYHLFIGGRRPLRDCHHAAPSFALEGRGFS